MKKMISLFGCVLVCAMLTNFAYAQIHSTDMDKNAPRKLTDPAMSQRLAKDWNTRNSTMTNQSVDWFNSDYGYYGTYTNENMDYMTRYDKKGNYVETMTKKDWNDMVPPNVKSSFDKSEYKSQMVNSYWEVSDPNRKGYYMELKDDQGKMTKVWADEKGNLTTTPYMVKPKN